MLMDTFDYIMAAVTIAWAIVAVCVLVVKGTGWMFEDEEEESDARGPDGNTAGDI